MIDGDVRLELTPEAPAAEIVQQHLQRYLDGRQMGLQVMACERISGGFETFIYAFEVTASEQAGSAPDPLLPAGRRLILRIYRGPGVVERSRWEAAVIGRVREAGVPAPAVHLYEPDPEPLGGPFLVLDLVTGARLDLVLPDASPLTVLRLIRNFARAQTAVYAIDWPQGRALVPGMAGSDLGPFAWTPDRLTSARGELERRNLGQLLPVVDWLETNQAVIDRRDDVLIHGDYHPLNVFAEGSRISGVIDWGAGGFANKHEDIGWTSLLIATASAVERKQDRRIGAFRTVGHRLYLASLWQACRLNRRQLRYGEVYAGLRWLLIFLPSYLPNAGPPLLTSEAVAFTTPRYVKRVRRFIEKRTKLKLTIE